MSIQEGSDTVSVDAIVVGAGFAGLYALHKLRQLGLTVQVYETADDVGGTWYWNRYPGARCDAQSLVYAFTFDEAVAQEWTWSERYATQPEILEYLKFIAARLDLRRDIRLGTRVAAAAFDERRDRWTVTLAGGEHASATWLVMASGALSAGRLPEIPGTDEFRGESYHTGSWPHAGPDFKGKRVAVIGTGSSAVQAIPLIAQAAGHLTVLQRTPSFIAPARNAQISADHQQRFSERRTEFRKKLKRGEVVGISDVLLAEHLPPPQPSALALSDEARQKIYEDRWAVGGALVARSFRDTLTDMRANDAMAEFFREKIREIVQDPAVAELLSPRDYPIGSKRICVGTDYYETFNRDNVTLIDVSKHPITRITSTGLQTSGHDFGFDLIVYATGFDAMTGALLKIDIRGSQGVSLRDAWAEGPQNYLGLSIAGFPNLFTITGPGSPSVLGNVVQSIEQHVEWMADLIVHVRERGGDRVEAEAEAQARWTEHVTAAAAATLMMQGKSWYLGANVPGKPRVFMPYVAGIAAYRDLCDGIAKDGYRGFRISAPAARRAQASGT